MMKTDWNGGCTYEVCTFILYIEYYWMCNWKRNRTTWTPLKDFGMTQRGGNVTKCPQEAGQHLRRARQREGVTYSCVRAEFYPNYNRFYQISAEIGHTPLHSFNLHTSPMAGLPGIDGTWLERPVRDVYVSLFSAPSIWECVGRHFTVTLLTGWQADWRQSEWAAQWPVSQPTMGPSIPQYSPHSSLWHWALRRRRTSCLVSLPWWYFYRWDLVTLASHFRHEWLGLAVEEKKLEKCQ